MYEYPYGEAVTNTGILCALAGAESALCRSSLRNRPSAPGKIPHLQLFQSLS